jgi:hypothetical protein
MIFNKEEVALGEHPQVVEVAMVLEEVLPLQMLKK